MAANGNLIRLEGKRFGALTVLRRAGRAKGCVLWRCRCDCGNEVDVPGAKLRQGAKKSCAQGHQYRQPFIQLTRMEQGVWRNMLDRCYNQESTSYKNYGGRGIRVCGAWRKSFQQFVADIGPRPSEKHTIDRYPDNDGDYEPGNVRWALPKEQMRNTRRTVRVVIDGIQIPLVDYTDKMQISNRMVRRRLQRGWSVEDAVSKPADFRKGSDPWPQEWLDYYRTQCWKNEALSGPTKPEIK